MVCMYSEGSIYIWYRKEREPLKLRADGAGR